MSETNEKELRAIEARIATELFDVAYYGPRHRYARDLTLAFQAAEKMREQHLRYVIFSPMQFEPLQLLYLVQLWRTNDESLKAAFVATAPTFPEAIARCICAALDAEKTNQ